MHQTLELWDYRRQVADLYHRVRTSDDPAAAWRHWREERDRLFATHPQSPLTDEALAGFEGLPCFDYDPAFRVVAAVEAADPLTFEIGHSGDGGSPASRFGAVHFELAGHACELSLFWIDVYGGGVFLPFRDATGGQSTYGGGRYLLDTVKSADLGGSDGEVVLDFNFAYHPSCFHNPAWSCPLAPPENRLEVAIIAGERTAGH